MPVVDFIRFDVVHIITINIAVGLGSVNQASEQQQHYED